MLLWFVVLAPVAVAEIFRSPMVDYRMVAAGAVLPLVEVLIGRPFLLHTLVAPVVVLTVVMLTTQRRRLIRRRLLGLPIGMFLHLVLDGTWATAELFWWPFFGADFSQLSVPEAQAPLARILLEVVAVVVAVVAWRRYGLDSAEARHRLLRQGHLPTMVRG